MARYRLRFLLQEIDLPRGTTLIGRSPECHVTIEDPLVSRQHARIVIDQGPARLEDLGSRNGVKVNGIAVKAPAILKDGDRLRIGTQELVFCELGESSGPMIAKTTGFLQHCARCRLPYAKEIAECPNCGSTEQVEEDTMTGQLGAESQHSWGVQLLLEVLDRALTLGRHADAVRALGRIITQVDDRIATGEAIDGRQLALVCDAACRASAVTREPLHAVWAVRAYARSRQVPPEVTVEEIGRAALAFRGELAEPVAALIATLRAHPGEDAARAAARLDALEGVMGGPIDPDTTSRNPALS